MIIIIDRCKHIPFYIQLKNEILQKIRDGVGTFVARKMPSLGFEPLISLTTSLKARGINPYNSIKAEEIRRNENNH